MPEQSPANFECDVSAGRSNLPYRIAVLCYLHDQGGRQLMLLRSKNPNAGMYSPIGGKLDIDSGEGPHDCARREIQEETGLDLAPGDIQLIGMVSETAYESAGHWLIFCFKVTRSIDPGELQFTEFEEGTLEWLDEDQIETIDIPDTDRKVLWPLVRDHQDGIFAVHIDCSVEPMTWIVHETGLG